RRKQLAKERPKEYKDRMITVERYKEFYVGARCEIVSVHHPVFAKTSHLRATVAIKGSFRGAEF
ncbi:TPA: hypothetical protein ACW72T_005600, partial [Klebsiella pneumoniae]